MPCTSDSPFYNCGVCIPGHARTMEFAARNSDPFSCTTRFHDAQGTEFRYAVAFLKGCTTIVMMNAMLGIQSSELPIVWLFQRCSLSLGQVGAPPVVSRPKHTHCITCEFVSDRCVCACHAQEEQHTDSIEPCS